MHARETIPADAAGPPDAVAAVTHPAALAYYAELVARRPIGRDPRLGLWVAASASAVEAVLSDPNCRVRPPDEPVPKAIVGTAAGDLFGRLVRMTDGGFHCPIKGALRAALGTIDRETTASLALEIAHALCARLAPASDPAAVTEICFRLPVHVVAGLLGIPTDIRDPVTGWIDAFVRCFAPGADAATIGRGVEAAAALMDIFQSAIADGWAGGLLARLAESAARAGSRDPALVAANAIGLLMQPYEATAGLIGNSLLALARHGVGATPVPIAPATLAAVVREVLWHDPPVHNTRRFVATPGRVAGQEMARGDAILVILAAASHDPALRRPANDGDPMRDVPSPPTFGHGVHGCPGGGLAEAIAAAALSALLAWGVNPERLAGSFTYRPSPNIRIPIWGRAGGTRPGE